MIPLSGFHTRRLNLLIINNDINMYISKSYNLIARLILAILAFMALMSIPLSVSATSSATTTGLAPNQIAINSNGAKSVNLSPLDSQAIAIQLDFFQARPPIHAFMGASPIPQGLTPTEVKAAYNLPTTGGSGTIAIISAFHHKDIEADLAGFDGAFSLAECNVKNKCLEIHPISSSTKIDSGWDMETALDTEWSHAIAPKAKILVVEASSDSGTALMKAVDYASSRSDVVSVAMSWGGGEFPSETKLNAHFIGKNKDAAFFASSGDDGAGVSWPASSANVVAVGGTQLILHKSQSKAGKISISLASERAWSGSGGGVSAYEAAPSFQTNYSILRSNGKRAIPDVSFAADPMYGFSVYHSDSTKDFSNIDLADPQSSANMTTKFSQSFKDRPDQSTSGHTKNWYIIGGTSAGAPQWAAINALGKSATLATLYKDKSGTDNDKYFRDIVSGKNGNCAYYCVARKRYDYVTGLGSPVTWKF